MTGQTTKSIPSPVKTQPPTTIPETAAVQSPRSKYQVAELPTKIDVKAAVSQKRAPLEERKWHSVEVGFETDEESSSNGSGKTSKLAVAPKLVGTRARSANAVEEDEEMDEEADDEEEDYESEIDELAEFVDKVGQSSSQLPKQNAPKIVESLAETVKQAQQPQDESHLSTLERGLAKRQSKGKYQVSTHYLRITIFPQITTTKILSLIEPRNG
jgi:hypothetical protein